MSVVGFKRAKNTLEIDGFVAAFYVDTKFEPPKHHYIVTRKNESEIVSMGVEDSYEAAEREATHVIRYWIRTA